jgi:parvulin-like peptidyl-prolyl isomerase
MQRNTSAGLLSLLLLSACSSDTTTAPAAAPLGPATKPAESPAAAPMESPKAPANVDMDAAIQVLMAKAEQPDEKIEVQHILIAFKGVPKVTNVTRSKDEAKTLAQKVYAEAIGGGDFDALIKQHTNDRWPGIYPITKAGRADWAKSFGDVGFRLKVGEIGVAPWDATASPFGWHIIKRLK